MKKEYTINWDNDNIVKLHNLAHNNILSYATVNNIIIDKKRNLIKFRSKHSYQVFKDNKFSSIAMYRY